MKLKRAIIIALDVVLAVYLVLAITAFNTSDDMATEPCHGVQVRIEKGATDAFLTAADVQRMLRDEQLDPTGKPLQQVNTRLIEEALQAKEVIDNAECFKTQRGYVSIVVRQRIPVVRVMAENGDSYYVDTDGKTISSASNVCHLIVATGSISRPYAQKVLAPIGRMLQTDDFWRQQVVQINVLPDSTLELVPRVGGHIAYLGEPTGIERKLERLRKFYLYGLSRVGWDRYQRISVDIDNQIVCKRKQ